MNRLVYANGKWLLTIDGKEVPANRIIANSLTMEPNEIPSVAIILDDVDIVEIETKSVDDTARPVFYDGILI